MENNTANNSQGQKKIGIVVLGMHRSGTSVVAGALSKAGVFFGDTLLPAESYNSKGFFEDVDILATNEEILKTLNSSFKDLNPLPEDWYKSLSLLPLRDRLKDLIGDKFKNAAIFGFKDPRVSILLPMYLEIFKELDLDIRFVVCERSTAEIIASLQERIGYSDEESLILYQKYKTAIEDGIKGQNYTRVYMSDFVDNPLRFVKNIFLVLDIPISITEEQSALITDFVDKKLKHHSIQFRSLAFDFVDMKKSLQDAELQKHKLQEYASRVEKEMEIYIESQKYLESHIARLKNTLSHRNNRISFLEDERQNFLYREAAGQGNRDIVHQDLHDRLDAIERSLSWRVVRIFQKVLDTLIPAKSVLRPFYVRLLRTWQKKPKVFTNTEVIKPVVKETEELISDRIDVLFINHEESRTGAPRIVFEIAKAAMNKYSIAVISKMKGGMTGEFHSTFKNKVFYPHEMFETRDRHELARIMLEKLKPKLVYVNSIVSYEYALEAKQLGIPVIFHIHEMASAFEIAVHKESHEVFASLADIFIVVSESTKRDLVKIMKVPEEKIRLIHEFIDGQNVLKLAKAQAENVVEDMLGIESDDILIVSMGTFDKRKGGDYFLKISEQITKFNQKNNTKVKMLWIGRRPRSHDLLSSMFKDYSNHFIHVDETENPFPFLKRAHVFFLASREDPFPLVVLESMTLGKPVVTFKKSGGAVEAGKSVFGIDEFNISTASRVLYDLALDKSEQDRRGSMAKEEQKSFEQTSILPKIFEEINGLLETVNK